MVLASVSPEYRLQNALITIILSLVEQFCSDEPDSTLDRLECNTQLK